MADVYASLFGPVAPVLGVDVVILAAGMVGLVLNVVLLWVTLRRRAKWAIDSLLMLIVAAADLTACLFVLASVGGRRLLGTTVLSKGGWMCGMGSVVFCAATATTLVFTALLAGVRYSVLVRGAAVPNRKFTVAIYILLAFVWVLFVGHGLTSDLVVVPSEIYCSVKFWGESLDSQVFGIVALNLLLLSVVLTPVFYALITRHYSRIAGDAYGTRTRMLYVIVGYPLTTFPEFVMGIVNRVPGVVRYALPDGIVITLLFGVTSLNALFALSMHADSHAEFVALTRSSVTKFSRFFSRPSVNSGPH